ncbi:MAG: TA system VapC family ribonuclease toxin [Bryobacteraceae bacterium]
MKRSTRPSLFPDVNVWIALTHSGHKHHRLAVRWLSSVDDDARLFFCRITQLSFLRLLSQAAVMTPDEALTQTEAWQAYDLWFTDSRVAFLGEPADVEADFRRLARLNLAGPKDWADSYLTAFAQRSGLTLVTFDRGFAGRVSAQVLNTNK